MSKPHRGKSIRDQVKHGKGLCPQCKKENIKVLYEHEIDGQKVKICKFCKAAFKNVKKTAAPAPAPAPAPVEESVPVADSITAEDSTPVEA